MTPICSRVPDHSCQRLRPRLRWPRTGLILLAITASAAITACGEPAIDFPEGANARVIRVVDGDTVVVDRGDGQATSVRLIGIDTPETVHPTKPVQCFGPEASRATKSLLPPGTYVRLSSDAEPTDRYGRTLAYVTRVSDGQMVQALLLEQGYARTLSIAPNTALAATFDQLAGNARAARRGLWGSCE